jgi:nicotinamidase-related amidase
MTTNTIENTNTNMSDDRERHTMNDKEKVNSSSSVQEDSSPSPQTQTPTQRRYEELKIKDGPLYKWNNDSKMSSSSPSTDHACNDNSYNAGIHQSTTSSTPSTWTTPSPLPAETTALLIVDVQPEYWSNCPAVRKDFPDFPEHLRKTIEICRERRAKIIWVRADYQHKHSPWLSQFERIRGQRNLGEVPCDPSSPEFNWEEFATPEGGEMIIAKSSWSSTSNTALVDILKVACIETVLVCGLITSVCVQHSAFGIFEAGYRTLLVTDACADRGRARHEAALALYGDYMYELVTSNDLESKSTGLIPAEPVWIVLDAETNMVRANSFPRQVTTTTTTADITDNTHNKTSTSMTSSMASTSSASFFTNNISIGNDDDDDDDDEDEEEETTNSDDTVMIYNNDHEGDTSTTMNRSHREATQAVDNLVSFLMYPTNIDVKG